MTTFTTAEGLRHLLTRLDTAGPEAWRTDPDAEQLMLHTITKYRPLAAKHHCDPDDSAAAAFEALRTPAVRNARDPWAVVTRAVQVTLIAEERANGLLCSPSQARRARIAAHHDARRFSDTETDLLEFHPAFRVDPDSARGGPLDHGGALDPGDDDDDASINGLDQQAPTQAFEAVNKAIALFVALGWPDNTATCALDYIASRLIESGSRPSAHEALRRDHTARALLDLDRRAWSTLLRLVLGNPNPDQQFTSAGHGVLVLILIGHPLIELLTDDRLVLEISRIAPRVARRHARGEAA